ncbi:MAG: hypothetical protein PHE33_09925 [Bacteroidales bacterium]|nr:hypothetical protein [Bacteroidales bacterium]
MKKIFTLLMVVIPCFLFSQVQLVSHDATKTYPDDTRITYMTLSDYPSDAEFLKFVENEVLLNTLIQRFTLGKDGSSCFFHCQKDITVDMIIEEINDAYYLYFTTEAYKTEKKEDPDKLLSNEKYSKATVKTEYDNSLSKEEYDRLSLQGEYNKSVSHTPQKFPNKVAEHAPDLDDPDYEIKKIEWVENYPEEYKNVLQQNFVPEK